jgi:hypothetical protein
MQSPAGVLLRTLLMLACLVAIPLAALFGSSFPKVVSSLLEGHWPVDNSSSSDAVTFQPAAISPAASEPPRVVDPTRASPPGVAPQGPTISPARAVDLTSATVIPAAYNAPIASPPTSAGAAAATLSGGNSFNEIRQRLAAAGASHFQLESWGHSGDLYRFSCEVPLAADPDFTRHFQVTAADPLAAMAQVLQEIEAWRKSRVAGP